MYFLNTNDAFVPPNPKLLLIAVSKAPSLIDVKMFKSLAASSIFLICADSLIKSLLSINREYIASCTPAAPSE